MEKYLNRTPITSLQNSSLTDQNDADYVELQNAYSIETLNNLNDPVGGLYYLQGIYARSEEIESPTMILATSNTDSFMYNRSQPGFEETNAYYFIDLERQYIGSLGFAPKWNGYDYIRFDAHGMNGDNNSHYSPSLKYLAYGDGGVDAGEDQDVIIHEYTHALHDVLMPGGLGSYVSNEGAVSEGSGDYLALSFRRTLSSFQPNHFSNWDLNASGRDLSPNLYFFSAWQDRDGNMWEPHRAGRLWSSTMMDIESNVGRDVATTLLLTSFSYVSYSSPVQDHVHAILQADRDIYNGSHLSALVSVFYQRGFFYSKYISGTVSTNTTWEGYKYATGDITVNSGVTLTISPNTFLFFASGTSLTINGTLTASGTDTTEITFDFISPNSTTQNGIKINTGATVNVSNSIIKNGWYGIYCNGTSSSPISNCEIMYCNTGIYFSSTNLGISNNYIHNNSMGIALYNSSPTLTLNKITGNTNYGISSSGSTSIPKFGSGGTQGKNKITGNPVGVCAFSNSLPMLGNNSPLNGGYNTFGENSSYNVYAITSGIIYAINNYWGTIPPTASKIWINNGVILYSPYLYSDPTGLSKAVPTAEDAVLALLTKAMNLIEQKNLLTAREICLDIINNYSNSYAAFNALSILTQTFDLSEKETINLNYKTLFNKDKKKLNAVAGLILAELDKENKLKAIDEVISKFKDDTILEDALFAKFLYYYNDIQDKENARLVSNELEKLFPNSISSIDAHHHLGDKDYLQKTYSFLKTDQEQKQNIVSSPLPEDYNLFANYPNPFNPTTVIKYALPFASNVNVTVYNTLGQIVKEFYEGTKEAGYYSVNFTGENLSSGVYLYSLNAISADGKQNFNATKKMLLLK